MMRKTGTESPEKDVVDSKPKSSEPKPDADEVYVSGQHPLMRLFSNHDKMHHHKFLGFLVLLHYMYRLGCIPVYGNMQWFHESQLTPMAILLHLTLSCSALQFHVPVKRTGLKPMIYREFLLHSILFAARALLVMVVCYLQPPGYLYLRTATVLFMHFLADKVSEKYGAHVSKTMRGMPYSSEIPEWFKNIMYKYYAVCQFFATYGCMSGHMDAVFLTVLPIQLAAFLMTLVRKNLISCNTWHIWYAGSLALNWVYFVYSAYRLTFVGPAKKTPEERAAAQLFQVIGFSTTILWGFFGRAYVSKYVFWAAMGLMNAYQRTTYGTIIWGEFW